MEMSICEKIFTSVLTLIMVAAVIALIQSLDATESPGNAVKPVATNQSRL